ncbi:MAG: hypothetical protein AB1633_09160 [Elusimicrobiota bacterium]
MTREEVAKIVEGLSKEDQLWLLNKIIRRFWPEFKGKPVAFYDPSEFWDDWDNKEVDEWQGEGGM